MSEWHWPNTVITRVIDGDTIDAHLTCDIGFEGSVTFPARLRLNRINAPKSSSKAGKATKAAVEQAVLGGVVEVVTVKGYKYGAPEDMTGEYMAEVRLPNGDNLSDELVQRGLAVYWNGVGPRPADAG